MMDILKVSNSEQGGTQIGRETVDLKSGSNDFLRNSLSISTSSNCSRYFFSELPVGYSSERDFAAKKQLCVLLSGRVEIGTSDRDATEVEVGDVILLADTDYRSPSRSIRVIGNRPARILTVQLE